MKMMLKKAKSSYSFFKNTPILIVSLLMLTFIGATVYIMYQGF